jgi:hypothetical protein
VGALGPVFRTYEPTRDRLVAVKVFRLDVVPEQAQALADELARAAEAELIHPSIVEPIAAGVEGTVAYRAEEYVAAESLDAAMRHYAPASFDIMLRIVGQLAEAVDAARAVGVGHGALHPRDIFMTPDAARASGFGVVEALERVGVRAPVRRPYSAPERIAGAAWSTPADVFSLGAIAFELLTGRRPSGTGTEIGPLTGAITAGAQLLQPVLARAMAEDPADRYQTGLALADALAAAGAALDSASAAGAVAPAPLTAAPLGSAAFADEDPIETPAEVHPTDSGSGIQMIALPPEAPVFAEERSSRQETTPSLFVDVPVESLPGLGAVQPPATQSGVDDIAAEPDEDDERLTLTRDEEAEAVSSPADVGGFYATEYEPGGDEAAADTLAFDAADLTLREDRPAVDDFHRVSRADREAAAFDPPPPVVTASDDFARAPGLLGLGRFEPREAEPQQVIERAIPALQTHDADEAVPFERGTASEERAGTRALPLLLMLLVGLLIGFGGGYLVRDRQPGPTAATATDATVPPAPVEPAAPQAGAAAPVGGRAANDRPIPPGPTARATTPALPAARSGTLVVHSSPSGAGVTINGKWSGRTPLTRRALAFGDYAVRVSLPGYQSKPEDVTLSADAASRTVSVQLQKEAPRAPPPAATRPAAAPAPATTRAAPETSGATWGGLEIDSRPTGARVFVDDRAVGVTPVRIPEIAPGSHLIRLELPEHRVWTETAAVTRGKTTRVAGSLEPIR